MSRGMKVNWAKNLDKRTVAILGLGEIGKAIHKVYEVNSPNTKIIVRDLGIDGFTEKAEFLHVCIPGNLPDFREVVLQAIRDLGGECCVIIHSTVQVGTTEEIGDTHASVVHSPCRGVHPNLYEGIMTFKKFIGADSDVVGQVVADELSRLGIKPIVVKKSRTTELLKLLDTSFYSVCIAFHGYAKQLCDQEGLDFDSVMTIANDTYNEGYLKLGMPQVIRPVLAPPTGPLGGHCCIPNARLLKEHFGSDPIIESILRWS
jgi:UDP-N-acetyl-D-mannosaminuronate dehydrogenase